MAGQRWCWGWPGSGGAGLRSCQQRRSGKARPTRIKTDGAVSAHRLGYRRRASHPIAGGAVGCIGDIGRLFAAGDCNRSPGDPTSIAEVSDGIFIPGNRNLAAAESRLNEVFWPYHHAITRMLAHRWRHGQGRAPALVAIHSFTPVMSGFRRPWQLGVLWNREQLGVLWNRDPRLALPLLARLRAEPDLCVGDNEPYSGREVGFTMDTHGGVAGLPHVEVEIRQDLIADDAGCIRWGAVVGDAIAAVFEDETLFRLQHY